LVLQCSLGQDASGAGVQSFHATAFSGAIRAEVAGPYSGIEVRAQGRMLFLDLAQHCTDVSGYYHACSLGVREGLAIATAEPDGCR